MVKSENCWFVFRIHILWMLLGHKRTSLPLLSLSVSLPPAWSHVLLCELGHSWGHSFWQTIQSMWDVYSTLSKKTTHNFILLVLLSIILLWVFLCKKCHNFITCQGSISPLCTHHMTICIGEIKKKSHCQALPVCVRWCALRCELLVYTFLHPLNWHLCTLLLPSGDASPLVSPDLSRVLSMPPVLIFPGECSTVCIPLHTWATELSLPSSGEDGGVLMMADPRSSPPSPRMSVKELEEKSRVGESSSELSEASLLASELKPLASRCWLSWLSSSSLMWGIFGSVSFDLSPQASISLLHRSSWLSNLRSVADT